MRPVAATTKCKAIVKCCKRCWTTIRASPFRRKAGWKPIWTCSNPASFWHQAMNVSEGASRSFRPIPSFTMERLPSSAILLIRTALFPSIPTGRKSGVGKKKKPGTACIPCNFLPNSPGRSFGGCSRLSAISKRSTPAIRNSKRFMNTSCNPPAFIIRIGTFCLTDACSIRTSCSAIPCKLNSCNVPFSLRKIS